MRSPRSSSASKDCRENGSGAARREPPLAALGQIRAVVETGTYRGTTTLFLARLFRVPVYSVDINPRYHYYARLRTRGQANIHLSLGDCRPFLCRLAEHPAVPRQDVFFLYDAHASECLPLGEEFDLIARGWDQSLVMIDDFAIPGDRGYGFDFDMDLLSLASREYCQFYRATPSGEETGSRRGCVLLAPPGRWADRLRTLSLVRERT